MIRIITDKFIDKTIDIVLRIIAEQYKITYAPCDTKVLKKYVKYELNTGKRAL